MQSYNEQNKDLNLLFKLQEAQKQGLSIASIRVLAKGISENARDRAIKFIERLQKEIGNTLILKAPNGNLEFLFLSKVKPNGSVKDFRKAYGVELVAYKSISDLLEKKGYQVYVKDEIREVEDIEASFHALIDSQREVVEELEEKEGEKKAKREVSNGIIEKDGSRLIFEQIIHEGKPCFLVYDGEVFTINDKIENEGEVIFPVIDDDKFYTPYEFYDGEINIQELVKEIYSIVDEHIDAPESQKIRWVIEIITSYVASFLPYVPYDFIVGDEETGKTTTGTILSKLCYRALFTQYLTAPNVYTYLENHPDSTIILENGEDLDRDKDLANVFREGYKKGAIVIRTSFLANGKRIQQAFKVYGFKVALSRKMLNDTNLLARFIKSHMMEGVPKKEEIDEEDEQKIREIRNKLLRWRMMTFFNGIEDVELDLRGRLKELWKPLLRVAKAINFYYEELSKQVLEEELKKQEDRRENENFLVISSVFHAVSQNGDCFIPFSEIWSSLQQVEDGRVDERKEDVFHSSNYGDISKKLLGNRIVSLFNPEKKSIRKEGKVQWCYKFSEKSLLIMARRYFCKRIESIRVLSPLSQNEKFTKRAIFKCPFFQNEKDMKCKLFGECLISQFFSPDLTSS